MLAVENKKADSEDVLSLPCDGAPLIRLFYENIVKVMQSRQHLKRLCGRAFVLDGHDDDRVCDRLL